MLEDQILFPEELLEDPSKAPYRKLTGGISKLEMEGFDIERFVHDVGSDLDEFDREHEEYEDIFIDDHEHEDDDDEGEDEDEDEDEVDHYAIEDSKNEHAEDSQLDSQLIKIMTSLGITDTADSYEKQTRSLSVSRDPKESTALERYVPSKEVQIYIDNWVNSESSYYDDLPMYEQFLDFTDREKATSENLMRCQMVLIC